MPAKSKSQQQAAGMALAAKRGEMSPSELKGAAKSMYDGMTEKELEKYASTSSSDLPDKVQEGDVKSVMQKARFSPLPDRKYLEDRFIAFFGPRRGHQRMSDKELAQQIALHESDDAAKAVEEAGASVEVK